MQRSVQLALVLSAATALLSSAVTADATEPPFTTDRPKQLVKTEPGVVIQPILSAGDVVGTGKHAYQMTGVPDGLGAYRSGPDTIEVFMNHELDGDPANARISHITLNNSGEVLAASYVVDGSEGFHDFCSGTLEIIDGVPWYFTGEEENTARFGGTSIALNANTGKLIQTPQFGLLAHENVVPIQGMAEAAVFTSEDGAHEHAQIYVYTARTFAAAIHGKGTLRTWVPTGPTDGAPSPNDIAGGQTLAGRLVAISQEENGSVSKLNRAAEGRGAMNFVRIEDAVADPKHPGVLYFADTGAARSETYKGRIYELRFDVSDPTRATLSVLLDADAGDDMFNPDNLAVSRRSLVIQEDRNYRHSGYDRVLVYDFDRGTLTSVARTDPTPIAIERAGGPGAWESSGVIDASALFGRGWWLLDVEAHETSIVQPGRSLRVDSAEGERGQLLMVFIPGT